MTTPLDPTDLGVRATNAAQAWAPGCRVADVQELSGGTSSLTFTALIEDGPTPGERVVLKVAPPGLEPVRNRDVNRQARLMRALADAPGVRVPAVYFQDEGAPPEVPPFHAMNQIPGECLEPILTPPPESERGDIPARAFAAARMLAALHQVDPGAVGLGDEPPITLADEIARWTRAFETVEERMHRGYQEAEALLIEKMPRAIGPSVCHGDYRLGNMLSRGDEVMALIDWEIWSLSDPRLDLAWFLMFTDEGDHPMARGRGPSGMPPRQALYDAYAEAAGIEPVDFVWFDALIRYKESSLTSLLIKRAIKSGGDLSHIDWPVLLPALTQQCIDMLRDFTPSA